MEDYIKKNGRQPNHNGRCPHKNKKWNNKQMEDNIKKMEEDLKIIGRRPTNKNDLNHNLKNEP